MGEQLSLQVLLDASVHAGDNASGPPGDDASPEYSPDGSPPGVSDASALEVFDGSPAGQADVSLLQHRRLCAWCSQPIPATMRRDSVFCSKGHRQAHWRFARQVETRERAGLPMRLAYADPPYPGLSRRYYGDHPDFAGEVDHAELLARLQATTAGPCPPPPGRSPTSWLYASPRTSRYGSLPGSGAPGPPARRGR